LKLIILLSSFFFASPSFVYSQKTTNEGTDFWMAFTEVYIGASAHFELKITAKETTKGVVTILGGSGFKSSFTVGPTNVTTILLPTKLAHNATSEQIVNTAIHIQSNKPISVQALTFSPFSTESSICLPSKALGSKYIVNTYPNYTEPREDSRQSEFVVVCGSKPAQIEIVPTYATAAGSPANKTIIVDLKPGDVYQVQSNLNNNADLTGTTVTATNGQDKFAVYCGHQFTKIAPKHCMDRTSGDPLYEVAIPVSYWGTEYISIRPKGHYMTKFRIVSAQNDCDIYRNSKYVTTINANEHYDGEFVEECMFLKTSKRATVSQFMVSAGGFCNPERIGDPSMVTLNSNAQMKLKSLNFSVADKIKKNYLVVITKANDRATILLDEKVQLNFEEVPGHSEYLYKIIYVNPGVHNLSTEGDGFLAYLYGITEMETSFSSAGLYLNEELEFEQKKKPNLVFHFLNDETETFEERLIILYNKNTLEIAEALYFNGNLQLKINGYTSTPGEEDYNQELALDRAKAVQANILIHLKSIYAADKRLYVFDESRIVVSSFGEDSAYLVEPNDNDLEIDDEAIRELKQAKNRRVEVEFKFE
jgi:IgGFc binding protein/OmpA family